MDMRFLTCAQIWARAVHTKGVRHKQVGTRVPMCPPSCVRHAPKVVRILKIPTVVKEQASQPVVWKHEYTAYRRGGGTLGSAVLWLTAVAGEFVCFIA